MKFAIPLKYFLILFVIMTLWLCSQTTSDYNKTLEEAERVMTFNNDSALFVLEDIEPTELKIDSIRAKYHYLMAYGHMSCNRSMIGDSLISFAHNYYRSKDKEKDIRSSTAFAWYKFWVGDTSGALGMLDSIVALPNVPDSLIIPKLRIRVLLGASEYQGRQLIPVAKKLIELETDSLWKEEAQYMLLAGYEYSG